MTLTITLTPEQETAIRQHASQRGLDPVDYILSLVNEAVLYDRVEKGLPTQEVSKRRATTARGKYASATRTVDDFLREKHEETEREERHWEEQHRDLRL